MMKQIESLRLLLVAVMVFSWGCAEAEPNGGNGDSVRSGDYDIRAFGAKGDGVTKDTEAIQRTIDVCAERGGGRVVIPPGEFVSGTLWLRSGVELHLVSNAVLRASEVLADYNREDAYPQNFSSQKVEGWIGAHLIIAHEVENVGITGGGVIDGSGSAFYTGPVSRHAPERQFEWSQFGMRNTADRQRHPRLGQLVVFIESRNVAVRGVTIRNASCWSLFFHGCENVAVRDYRVRNGPSDANTDGVDVDCCRNVRLENLDIVTGDDGIAIRGSPTCLKVDRVCEHVRIKNCRIESSAEGIRIGVGNGCIRDVVIEDVRIVRAGWGVLFQTAYGKGKNNGVDIEDVTLRNVSFGRGCLGDHRFEIGGDRLEFGIRNITFDRCVFLGGCGGETKFVGDWKKPPENVRYDHCVFERRASAWKVLPIYGGGWIQNVEIAKSSPNVWYTYVDVGGPYRSDDYGANWKPLHGNMPDSMRSLRADHVRTLSVDPRDADSFVMVAGDWFDNPAGVYVSRDGGRTYRRTLLARFYGDGNRRWQGLALARHPQNPDRLVCSADWDGIFVSDDNGDTWRSVGCGGVRFSDVKWDRNNPELAYACAAEAPMDTHVPQWYPQQREFGFFRSSDGGRTWRKLSATSPTEIVQIRGQGRLVGILANEKLVCSDDGGVSWQSFHDGLPSDETTGQKGFLSSSRFAALAAGPDFWLCGDTFGTLYRRGTSDGRWQKLECETMTCGTACEGNMVIPVGKKQKLALSAIVVDEDNPSHWLTTDWHLIWETHDAGRNWVSRVRGLMPLVPFCVACDPTDGQRIAVGVADVGVSLSDDGGASYSAKKLARVASSIAWCRKRSGVAFSAGGKRGSMVSRTEDGGKTWSQLSGGGLPSLRTGVPQGREDVAAYDVAVSPANDWVYLCVSGPCRPSQGGVYRSRDYGRTWEWYSKGLPSGECLFRYSEFMGGGSAGWTPQLVLGGDGSAVLSTIGKGVAYYLDKAKDEWQRIEGIVNPSCSRTFASDPFTPGRFLFANGHHFLESVDGGQSWKTLYSTYGCGNCVSFDAHTPGLVVSANADDALVSVDGGLHFSTIANGLAIPSGTRRWVYVDRGRLFFLTRGSGVYVRNLDLKALVP